LVWLLGLGIGMAQIRSFRDLDVYKRLYGVMLRVAKEVLPILPKEERFGLVDQMRRASKAPLAIIAEGYAKKHHIRDWLRYINDALGECNEMVVHLSCCKDIYPIQVKEVVINELMDEYEICCKQLYRLGESWKRRQ